MTATAASLTVVMPAYNEADNLRELVPETIAALRDDYKVLRVLVVDDGSTDDTPRVMGHLMATYPEVDQIRLRRNSGKSEALRVGFRSVDTDLVAVMDADGQDDPRELEKLRKVLDRGVDQVTGYRVQRQDRPIKRHTSRLFNLMTRRLTGVSGRDFNSGLKLMRKEVVDNLELYGELHRYIPVLATWAGFAVDETAVVHRPRRHGQTKFGRARYWRGLLDLITVKFLTTYTARPFHLFGGAGLLVGTTGFGLLLWMLISKVMGNAIGGRPALLLGVVLVLVGIQLMSLGLMAELLVHHRRGGIASVTNRQTATGE